MKNLQNGNLDNVDLNLMFNLLRWCSGDVSLLKVSSKINRDFYFTNNLLVGSLLSLYLKPNTFIPYPKPKKFDQNQFDILAKYLKNYYKLSTRKINSSQKIIENILKDKKKLNMFAENFGLTNIERKVLKLQELKFDKSKMKISETKSLFKFGGNK